LVDWRVNFSTVLVFAIAEIATGAGEKNLPEVCTLAVTSLHRLSGAVFHVKGMG